VAEVGSYGRGKNAMAKKIGVQNVEVEAEYIIVIDGAVVHREVITNNREPAKEFYRRCSHLLDDATECYVRLR